MAETVLPSLDRLDAAKEWKPWQPGPKEPFDLKWAGHLFRRAAFGGSLDELRQAVKDGLPKTLDLLLDGQPGADERMKFLNQTGETIARQNNVVALRAWWLYSMLHSLHPLREKITLFWHDHFATSIAKIGRTWLMYKQNLTLREHSLGKFGPMLTAMSKDPAMLNWLDSNSNVKGKPNENYAREVMELFSLGVGNYTEKDVQEAARAFTGWHADDDKFAFSAKLHDDEAKTVLGQTGKWDGGDVLRILLEQPAAPRFLTRKLYRYLISEAVVPPDSFLEPLSEAFRKSGYDVKQLVRAILSSRHFFSAHAYRQKIKNPVEYTLGAVWSLTSRAIPQGALVPQTENMGQSLFAPPNVKGWPGGPSWLNTSTVLARHNFAFTVATGGLKDTNRYKQPTGIEELREREEEALLQAQEQQRLAEEERLKAEGKPVPPRPQPKAAPLPAPPPGMDVAELVRKEKATTPKAIAGVLADLLLQGDLNETARTKLTAFLEEGKPAGADLDRRIREAAHMIMTMPEYQLN